MQSNNRFFDDAARLAGGAMGTLVGIRREVEAMVRQQLERLLEGLDLVRREEFDAVSEMAANARAEQDRLAERVAALETALKAKPAATGAAKAKKPAGAARAKKPATRKPARAAK